MTTTYENPLLAKKHLNHLPQRAEFPARTLQPSRPGRTRLRQTAADRHRGRSDLWRRRACTVPEYAPRRLQSARLRRQAAAARRIDSTDHRRTELAAPPDCAPGQARHHRLQPNRIEKTERLSAQPLVQTPRRQARQVRIPWRAWRLGVSNDAALKPRCNFRVPRTLAH